MGHLRAAGVEIPDGAQIWGPGDGWAWRLVDRRGQPLQVGSRVTLRRLAASVAVELRDEGGWRALHPVW